MATLPLPRVKNCLDIQLPPDLRFSEAEQDVLDMAAQKFFWKERRVFFWLLSGLHGQLLVGGGGGGSCARSRAPWLAGAPSGSTRPPVLTCFYAGHRPETGRSWPGLAAHRHHLRPVHAEN